MSQAEFQRQCQSVESFAFALEEGFKARQDDLKQQIIEGAKRLHMDQLIRRTNEVMN